MRANRSYKKGEPFRDATIVAILTEGQREAKYFEKVRELLKPQKLIIEILPPVENKSAPNYAEERIRKAIEELGLIQGDQIWLVFDVDCWQQEILAKLSRIKQIKKITINLIISNPCFEVWLWQHYFTPEKIQSQNCSDLKNELHLALNGGFEINRLTLDLLCRAMINAQNSYQSEYKWKPSQNRTQIFRLTNFLFDLSKKKC